ncbi:hypothetical protein AB751O23_BR_00060 [Chlamydiales bacterium SCGC AB-751-O23]|nr:hypothetical protein AB751O23_BR_00060 [Chlamydiales bacterium SCGC AB-751-O23]
MFFLNFYHNLVLMKDIHHGNRLFQKFKNCPAIICGAGPSFDKQFDILKKWQNKALIFAGGSSINSLGGQGVIPHFGAGIDPNKSQLDRSKKNTFANLPMFYRNRWNGESLTHAMGPRLYLNGCGGYSVAEWFEKELNIEGRSIEEGHNVINFLVEIANNLGCNPIIFVGMDLALTEGKRYADGVVSNSIVGDSLLKKLNVIHRKDIHGNVTQTLRKWVVESDWIGSYAKVYPDVSFINATGSGLGMPGVPNQDLEEILDSGSFCEQDLFGLVNLEVQRAKIKHIKFGNVLHSMADLGESLSRCVAICEKLDKELSKVEKKVKKMKSTQGFSRNPVIKKMEDELLAEPAYKCILEELNSVRLRLLQRKLEELNRDNSSSTKTAKSLDSIKINKERLFFLKQVATNNLYTMQKTVEDFAKKGYDIDGFKVI